MNRWLVLAAMVLALGGCARVQTQISRVHTLPPSLAGKTFVVVPSAGQQGNPEFALYANDIAARLTGQGMTGFTGSARDADYVLLISYGIGDGSTTTSAVPIFGQTGGGTSYTNGTVNAYGSGTANYSSSTYTPPTYGMVGSVPVTQTVYTRTLEINLVDVKLTPDPDKTVSYAFKGRGVSTGSSASFMAVSQCMIEAIMKDFPGVSGTTKTVEAMGDKCVR